MQAWRDIATIVNKRGLDGGLVLQWRTGLSCVFDDGVSFYLVPPQIDAPRCVHVADGISLSTDDAIVKFSEVDDPNLAERLIGCHVLIDADNLDGSFEDQSADDGFLGWTLVDEALGEIGCVVCAEPRFEQVLLEVEVGDNPSIQGERKLIPLVEDIVVKIDEDQKILTIDCPAGLLDL